MFYADSTVVVCNIHADPYKQCLAACLFKYKWITMKLTNCILNIDMVAMLPPVRTSPRPDWQLAHDNKVIPENVYRFYCCCDYFSLDKTPKFFDDKDRFLFSFLHNTLEGIRLAFTEANDLIKVIKDAQGKGYSPFKGVKNETWDPNADERQSRSVRYLIVLMSGVLDQLAEVVSMFFHGDIPKLTVGRASFTVLREFARHPFSPKTKIVTPKEYRFGELHAVLVEVVETSGSDKQWFELLKLYRNKLAHLGTSMFPIARFHDDKGEFYSFLPNQFPIFHESVISFSNEAKNEPMEVQDNAEYAKENYIHQDVVEYSEKLLEKVYIVIDRCFKVLCSTYIDFKSFDLNESALKSLKDKKSKYNFRYFDK